MREKIIINVVLYSLLINITGIATADDTLTLFPIRQNGKFGFINATGETVIPPQFLRGNFMGKGHFHGGLQVVSVGDKYGYIDTSGKMVIEPQFSHALSFSEGLAAVRVAGTPWNWGYIDKTGRLVIPPQFEEAHEFSDGIAQVIVGRQAGYIDKSGAFIVKPQYRSFSPQHSTFSEGLACVEVNSKWGFLDRQGNVVIEARLEDPSSFHDGLAVAKAGVKFSARWGFIDKTGAFAIEPRFSLAWQFSEGLARVRVDGGGMAFIDKTGAIAFTVANGQWGGEFSEGLVNVRIGASASQEKWGYLDRGGKWAIEPKFQRAEPFHKGLAQVFVDNKVAYIDPAGHYVWGPDSGDEALATKLRKQASPEDWQKNKEKLLRLARLIDPINPPLTEESLQSGSLPVEALQKLAAGGSENARQLLEQLLSYTANPALVQLSPGMAAMQQGKIQTQVARALVAIGDPFVVPTLRVWLRDASKTEGELDLFSRTTVNCAIEGLKQFRDEASLAPMEALLKSPDVDRWMREAILTAIATLSLPQAKPTLIAALKDDQLSEHIRSAIAAALVHMGEPAGRQFLLNTYELYLDSLRKRSSDHGHSRGELEFLGDSELITILKAKADAEPPGVPKNNINTLLDVMRVSAMPVEQLKEMAAKGGDENLNLRLHAICIMSRQGGIDLLPFLESLQLAPDDYMRSDWNNMRRQATADAIRQIRMHRWQQFPSELK